MSLKTRLADIKMKNRNTMKNKTILSEHGLNEFNIGIKEIYEKAYEISGSELSNSCFLHRICWNVLFKYSYQIKGSYICLVADDNEINRAHIVYPLGEFSNQELKDIVNYWRMIFGKYNKHLRIEFIDEVGLSRLRTCLDEEGILWHQENCEECYDYTYRISDYVNLKGKKNRGKRHFWNHYLNNPDIYRLEKVGNENVDECRKITKIWESQKGLSGNDLINTDHYPLEFLWKHIDEIDNCSYILYRCGVAIAFFVATIDEERCIFHFAKSDRTYPEANFIIHQLFLNSDNAKKIKTLNFEDDMSDLNIRKYKSNLAQNKLLRKYAVEVEG